MLSELWDRNVARILCTILIFVVALAFLFGARETLTLFLFSILFAYFVEPLVARLERPLHGRIRAIAVVYLLLTGILVGLGFVVGSRIVDEARALATSLPTLIDKLGSGQLVSQVGQKHGWSQARQVATQNFLISHREDILRYGRALGAKIAQPAQHIWWIILIPILSLFFLKDGTEIAHNLVTFGRSRDERSAVRGIVGDVNVMLGSYIRAQLILSSLTLVVYTIFLSILRVPYAFILGPLAGLFEFVPVVGPAVAAISVLVIAILVGYPHLLWIVLFLGIWRLVQDYVTAPRIMGQSLEISPLLQIFGVLAGGEIGGVVGALISVPVIATLRILWRRLHETGSADIALTSSPTSSRIQPAEVLPQTR